MSNDDKFWGGILGILLVVVLVIIGTAIGFDWGQDDIANDWCVSLGYDTGEYDDGAESIVCQYIETLEIEKGE